MVLKKVVFRKLNFTTAGIPISMKNPNILGALDYIYQLNLDGMELEFVRGVNFSIEKAQLVKELVKKNSLVLTAHGPYYINLNASERAKYEASKQRVYKTAEIAYYSGAFSITFHAAYYMKSSKSEVYNRVKTALREIESMLIDSGIEVDIRPELTGKPSQFGDLNELFSLHEELEFVKPCIDFAHYVARYGGKTNNVDDIRKIFDLLEQHGLTKDVHFHMSGIEWSDKGERRHLELDESKFIWKEVIKLMKEYSVLGVVVSESPSIEFDAIKMKRYYNSL